MKACSTSTSLILSSLMMILLLALKTAQTLGFHGRQLQLVPSASARIRTSATRTSSTGRFLSKATSSSSSSTAAAAASTSTTLWMNASSSSSSVGGENNNNNNNNNNKNIDPFSINLSGKRNRSELIREAEALKAKAKEIYAEAAAMEEELDKVKSKKLYLQVSESDELIDLLFKSNNQNYNYTRPDNNNEDDDDDDDDDEEDLVENVWNPASVVAERLQKDRWSTDQVLNVVDRISQRQAEAMGRNMSAPAFKIGGSSSSSSSSQNNNNNNNTTTVRVVINETEYERLADAMDTLLGAVAILDREKERENKRWSGRTESAVKSRINELKRTQQSNMDRWIAAEINRVANSTESVEAYVRQTFGGSSQPTTTSPIVEDTLNTNPVDVNASDILERIALVPMWVPSSFLPFIISCQKSTLGAEQVETIINDVLMGSRFYMTSHESVSGAALFRGNVRTPLGAIDAEAPKNDTAKVFQQIQKRLAKRGLADEVQLFMLPDPEWRPGSDDRDQNPKPVILALSKAVSPDESKIEPSRTVNVAKKLMYPLSFMTTFLSVVVAYSLNENFFDKIVNQRNLSVLRHCVAPTVGIVLIQTLHEVAHYLMAKKRRIKIGFPVPIPSFQLGIFGCITPLKSFPKNRSDLLDFALSGPLASVVASLACIVAGTILTTRASPLDIAGFAVFPAQLLRTSCLIGSIIACLGSKMMMVPLAQPLAVHPMFLVGYAGLFAAALNLLPIFRLDGGRACSAVFGQRVAAVVSVSMLLFLFSCALSGKMGTGFSWILLITIFQRRQEIPARDEVTDVSKPRLWAFLFSFLLSVSILTPFPGGTSLL